MYIIKKIWSDDVTELTNKHTSLDQEQIFSSSYLVYKISSGLHDVLINDKSHLTQIRQRYPNQKVLFLKYTGGKVECLEISADNRLTTFTDIEISEIRKHDLKGLVENNSYCTISAPQDGHFVTPSGRHATHFVRGADALNSFNALDRISFWLREVVDENCAGVIVDVAPLMSVTLHSSQLNGINVPFTCLKKNIVGQNNIVDAKAILSKFKTRIKPTGNLVILLSLSVSGTTMESIEKCCKDIGFQNNIKTLNIFSFPNSSGTSSSLCELSNELTWHSDETNCLFCISEHRKKKYPIDPNTLYPTVSTPNPIKLSIKHLDKLDISITKQEKQIHGVREFYRAYGKVEGLFKYHYTDKDNPYSLRHHAVYLDINNLIDHSVAFQEEVKRKVAQIIKKRGEIGLIVLPKHEAAKKLENVINIAAKYTVIESESLCDVSAENKSLIRQARHILILDDCCITGGRSLAYLRSIRCIYEGVKEEDIKLKHLSFFSTIIRPPKIEIIGNLIDGFSKHRWTNHLDTLYQFLLPHWNETQCPWCFERNKLSELSANPFDENNWIQKRIDLLDSQNMNNSPSSTLFSFPNTKYPDMSASSPMIDTGHNEDVVLFLVSSAIQASRDNPKYPLGHSLLKSNVFSFDSFTRFSDGLLQAALLRFSKCHEWDESFFSLIMENGIKSVLQDPEDCILPELLLQLIKINTSNLPSSHFKSDFGNHIKDESVECLIGEIGR